MNVLSSPHAQSASLFYSLMAFLWARHHRGQKPECNATNVARCFCPHHRIRENPPWFKYRTCEKCRRQHYRFQIATTKQLLDKHLACSLFGTWNIPAASFSDYGRKLEKDLDWIKRQEGVIAILVAKEVSKKMPHIHFIVVRDANFDYDYWTKHFIRRTLKIQPDCTKVSSRFKIGPCKSHGLSYVAKIGRDFFEKRKQIAKEKCQLCLWVNPLHRGMECYTL